MKMNRAEALRIGTVIANRWWRHNKPIILSQQHIDKQKAWQQIKSDSAGKQRVTKKTHHKEILAYGKELSTLDQYLTDPSWGKSNIKETNNRKIRRNLLTDEELACDQDDLGNFVSIWDHVYLIHLSRKSKNLNISMSSKMA